jgi:putative salt-induced outer membrane protein
MFDRHAHRGLFALLAVLVIGLLPVTPAAAQWSGKGQLGVVVSSGNSTAKSGSLKLAATNISGPWTHKFNFASVYSSDAVSTTAQRWEAQEQSNYAIDKDDFVFGGLRYENDRFSGFDHQSTLSVGLGHLFFRTDVNQLSAQLGAGYKTAQTRNPKITESSMAAISSLDYRHAFNASTSLLDKATVEYAKDNTFLHNEIAVEVKLTSKLALAVAFQVRNNSSPPAAFKKTDTLTTVNVVYEIK